MPKKPSDPEFLNEFAAQLETAIVNKGLTWQSAAAQLGVTRQSLYLYRKARVAPSPDVIRRAMELWQIELTYRHHKLTLQDLSTPLPAPRVVPVQMGLWDALKKLDNQSVKVELKDRGQNSIELKVSIQFGN